MNGILEMTKCMNQNVDERILNGMSALPIDCLWSGLGKKMAGSGKH
jgi:hypothetical protein